MRKEITEQKAVIEKVKEEAKKKARTYEAAVMDIHNKDGVITEYCSKIKRCSRAI